MADDGQWWPSKTDPGLLRICLSAAVPLRIEKLRRQGDARRLRDTAVDVVASNGDALLRKTRATPGEPGTARTFNEVASGIALLALRPGGVHVLGAIWCAEHSPCGEPTAASDDVQRTSVPCTRCVSEGQVGS